MGHLGTGFFSVGDRVVVRPTGQTGTVAHIEPRPRITGQVLVHIRVEECPRELVQPEMSLLAAETEDE